MNTISGPTSGRNSANASGRESRDNSYHRDGGALKEKTNQFINRNSDDSGLKRTYTTSNGMGGPSQYSQRGLFQEGSQTFLGNKQSYRDHSGSGTVYRSTNGSFKTIDNSSSNNMHGNQHH